MVRIGVHIDEPDPLGQATARGADAVQFFLGDPQGWKGPVIPGDPAELKASFAAAGVEAYIHAPYVVNVATTNNRIRIPSRKILTQQLEAAASIGAKGLIVHGGHVTGDVDPAEGYANWQKVMERVERPDPAADREHRGRDPRDGPDAGRHRPPVGRGDGWDLRRRR